MQKPHKASLHGKNSIWLTFDHFSILLNIIYLFLYSGETHSEADRDDKMTRSGTDRMGKPCDFIFWVRILFSYINIHKYSFVLMRFIAAEF